MRKIIIGLLLFQVILILLANAADPSPKNGINWCFWILVQNGVSSVPK